MIQQSTLDTIRQIDLYDYLLTSEPDKWHVEKKYLRNKEHSSLIVTKGKGWIWNSQNLRGNTNIIDFLCAIYGFSFKTAVQAVVNGLPILPNEAMQSLDAVNRSYNATKILGRNNFIYNYLCNERGLSNNVISSLISQSKIYLTQQGKYYNICFYEPETNHYQINGITHRRFKRCSDGKNYWWFGSNEKDLAYICESPIDAISLYQLLKNDKATYISIGGCGSRSNLIKKVIGIYSTPILALDNDTAGDNTAKLYPHIDRLIPSNKDWNDVLLYGNRTPCE